MQLKVTKQSDSTVEAGYSCPCGCTPAVLFSRGSDSVHEGCCCGNDFVVGPGASTRIHLKDGFHAEAETFTAPWGDQVEAAWAIGPSKH